MKVPNSQRDGSQFDRFAGDGDELKIGDMPLVAIHVPGPHARRHGLSSSATRLFVGDTMFMPDYGTARADFPGGDARDLYHSIRRLLELPDETRLFLCHDYKAPNRDDYAWETTSRPSATGNVHVHDGVSEDDFVEMRTQRDATLPCPS